MAERQDTVPPPTMGGDPITFKTAVGVPTLAGAIAGLWVAEHSLGFLASKPWRQELAIHAKGTAIGATMGLTIGTLAWTFLRDKDPAEAMRRRTARNSEGRDEAERIWTDWEANRRAATQSTSESLSPRR